MNWSRIARRSFGITEAEWDNLPTWEKWLKQGRAKDLMFLQVFLAGLGLTILGFIVAAIRALVSQ